MGRDVVRKNSGRETGSRVHRSRVILLAAALTVAVVVGAGLRGWQDHDEQPRVKLPASEQSKLAAEIVPIVEKDLPDAANGTRIACAIKTLGTDPSDAVTADGVVTAYFWALCDEVKMPTSSTSQAVAVHLGVRPRVEIPDMADYSDNVRKLFPRRLHNVIFDNDYAAGLETQVQQRVKELS
jgi:hypothetical protein